MMLKRALDLVLTALLSLVAIPILALAAMWVQVISPGPVFYLQDRIGKDGGSFTIFKLRTMKPDADRGPLGSVTVRNDSRIVLGGMFLRKFKVDELPQLFNVLGGSMSLVGPRPTVPEDYERMTERQRRRQEATPGITGLAQINGSTALSWPERIEYDLQYLRDRSLGLDLKILLTTVGLVLTGRADTHPPGDSEW